MRLPGVVEHAVYVDPAASAVASAGCCLGALAESTEAAGIWTIQSGIFPENAASLRLHAAAGFRVVGVRERIAKMTYGPMSRAVARRGGSRTAQPPQLLAVRLERHAGW